MTFFHRKSNWQLKKYLFIAHDITSALLNKEKQKEDKRVRTLTIVLIILAVVLVVSFAYNVYLVTGA
jgi:amino acid permease